jgi:recombination protein RecA
MAAPKTPKKSETLAAAKAYLLKTEGEGAVISLSGDIAPIPVIPTGSFLIDAITGVGGLPCGRLVELFGQESSGKSTVLSSCAAQCQQQLKRPVLYLDYEAAIDPKYLLAQGVDLSEELFIYSQPGSMEEGFRIAEYYIDNGLVGLVIADSVAAMITAGEVEGEIGNTHAGGIAAQARVMSVALKKLVPLCAQRGVTFAFINQVRTNLSMSPWERSKGIVKETTPGGSALKFYASMRIQFKKVATVKGKIFNPVQGVWEEGIVATKVRAEVVKNKVGPPFRRTEFIIKYGIGVDDVMSIILVAVERKVLKKSGSFIKIPALYHGTGEDTNIQGLEAVCEYFRKEFPPGFEKLEEDIKGLIQHDLDFSAGESYESDLGDIDLADALEVPEEEE